MARELLSRVNSPTPLVPVFIRKARAELRALTRPHPSRLLKIPLLLIIEVALMEEGMILIYAHDHIRHKVKPCWITFYSFKGGAGRSLALANLAARLVSRGRRVVLIDCPTTFER